MKRMKRLWKNLILTPWAVKSYFTKSDITRIESSIRDSERQHRAEIRIVIEKKFSIWAVLSNLSTRNRALSIFSDLQIWDTNENNGVLIYLLLAERKIEIVADRGIVSQLDVDYWQKTVDHIISLFHKKEYIKALIDTVEHLTDLMVELYPKQGDDPNELPDELVFF